MAETRVICFANNKGGSGKSTTCSNVGYFMASEGKKVLLIDGDMQLNLSLAYFDEEKVLSLAAGDKNLYCAIRKQDDLTDYVLPTGYENLDIVPSSTLMSSIEFELFSKWQREYVLKKCLQKIEGVRQVRLYFDRFSAHARRLGHEYFGCVGLSGRSGRSKPVGIIRIVEFV